jgi:hypothetical protein
MRTCRATARRPDAATASMIASRSSSTVGSMQDRVIARADLCNPRPLPAATRAQPFEQSSPRLGSGPTGRPHKAGRPRGSSQRDWPGVWISARYAKPPPSMARENVGPRCLPCSLSATNSFNSWASSREGVNCELSRAATCSPTHTRDGAPSTSRCGTDSTVPP